MKNRLSKGLKLIGQIYLFLIAGLVLINKVLGIFLEPNLTQGMNKFFESFSPFNISFYVSFAILASPGLILLKLGEYLGKRKVNSDKKSKINCHLLDKEQLIEKDLSNNFIKVKTFMETNHLERSLLQCKECRQYYYYEFNEQVDLVDGDDKIYSTYFPIDPSQTDILNKINSFELLSITPRINWNPDNKIFWVR